MRYKCILADPPWRYGFSRSRSRRVENHYATMTLDDIKTLPVAEIAADDSLLFLWATAPKLPEALEVVKAWGFKYLTCDVWLKQGRKGMGYYWRIRHELILLGRRGSPGVPLPKDRPDSVFSAPNEGHSRKPALAQERIERMFPSLTPRLELFARSRRPGWHVWGNEVESDIGMEAARSG